MVNGFLHCVVSVRDYCRYLTTSSEQNSLSKKDLARLKKKADGLLSEFKHEIERILFWKEIQHFVVQKMKGMREASEADLLKAKSNARDLRKVIKANLALKEKVSAVRATEQQL